MNENLLETTLPPTGEVKKKELSIADMLENKLNSSLLELHEIQSSIDNAESDLEMYEESNVDVVNPVLTEKMGERYDAKIKCVGTESIYTDINIGLEAKRTVIQTIKAYIIKLYKSFKRALSNMFSMFSMFNTDYYKKLLALRPDIIDMDGDIDVSEELNYQRIIVDALGYYYSNDVLSASVGENPDTFTNLGEAIDAMLKNLELYYKEAGDISGNLKDKDTLEKLINNSLGEDKRDYIKVFKYANSSRLRLIADKQVSITAHMLPSPNYVYAIVLAKQKNKLVNHNVKLRFKGGNYELDTVINAVNISSKYKKAVDELVRYDDVELKRTVEMFREIMDETIADRHVDKRGKTENNIAAMRYMMSYLTNYIEFTKDIKKALYKIFHATSRL